MFDTLEVTSGEHRSDLFSPFAMLLASAEPFSRIEDWPLSVLEALPTPVYTTDADGRITFFNRAAAELAGRTPKLGVDKWCVTWKLYNTDNSPLPHDQCPMAVALREDRPVRGAEAIAERPDGTRVPFTPFPTPLHDRFGNLVGAVNVLLDITARKKAEDRIAYLANTDSLTELPNRAALAAQLSLLISNGAPFTLISVDLDGFRDINDTYGLRVGDEVLRQVAKRLGSVVGGASAFRVGDDEFVLIVLGVESETGVTLIIERLQDAVGLAILLADHSFRIGFSAGVARFPKDARTEIDLVGNADAARRLAKREARGTFRFFDSDQNRRLQLRQILKDDLQAAIGTSALRLHFQPQARPDGGIVGFEALIRWTHPVHGNIPPDQFIPLAEESGLIIPLSNWILRAACTEAASWTSLVKVSVNLSPVQFQDDDLVPLVGAILAETGLAANRLVLEVTEGVLIADYARAMTILNELCALGAEIALDDFGSGYSSLSYLQEFPFSEIKIDRNFTAKLGICARSKPIVRSVIELGHALGLRVVAEGVETADQIEFLSTTHCDLVQGYLTGRPAAIESYAGVTAGAA